GGSQVGVDLRSGLLDRRDNLGKRRAPRRHLRGLDAYGAERGKRATGVKNLDGNLMVALGDDRRRVGGGVRGTRFERIDEAEDVLGALAGLAIGGEKVRGHRSRDHRNPRLLWKPPVE